MIHFTVGVYVTKEDSGDERWTALTPVAHYAYVQGRAYDSRMYALILDAWHRYWEVRRAIRRVLKRWIK